MVKVVMLFKAIRAAALAAILCSFSPASAGSLPEQQLASRSQQQLNTSSANLDQNANYFNQHLKWTPIRHSPQSASATTTATTSTTSTRAPVKLPPSQVGSVAGGHNESESESNTSKDYDEDEDVLETAASEQEPPCAHRGGARVAAADTQMAAASSPRAERSLGAPSADGGSPNADDEPDEQEDEADEQQQRAIGRPADQLHGNESVSLGASIAAPLSRDDDESDAGVGGAASQEADNEEHASEQDEQSAAEQAPGDGAESMPGAAEQEAAEASEAEAANQSALDEQQQQQREIILAQAQSEAKAIKEQQEALLRQQIVQQQMLMKRHQNDMDATARVAGANRPRSAAGGELNSNQAADLRARQREERRERQQSSRRRAQTRADRIEFSDQPNRRDDAMQVDGYARGHQVQSEPRQAGRQLLEQQVDARNGVSGGASDDELAVDYSVRQPIVSAPLAAGGGPLMPLAANVHLDVPDLMPTAYHNYGSHYGSLSGHHKGGGGKYYQFAESHKKGQFESGFKRGNKKFHISGHSSQHKNHAEGHVKWHGKKGKGSHYWAFKHKNKKHHKAGHYY